MKWTLVFLIACGGTSELPAKPDVKGMGPDQKCLATVPRGTSCSDELLAGELARLGAGGIEEQIGGDTSKREALAMHKVRCAGDAAYADSLVRCWDAPDCKALAACVYAKK